MSSQKAVDRSTVFHPPTVFSDLRIRPTQLCWQVAGVSYNLLCGEREQGIKRCHPHDVASIQFDGLHVEHCETDTYDERTGEWVQLEAAIRGAEQAVQTKLGYTIKLKEKELFEAPPQRTSVE